MVVITKVQRSKRRLKTIFGRIGLEQGDASENYFEDVLKDGLLRNLFPQWLKGYKHIQKYSKTDTRGIDFLIFTDKRVIKVNVKSSMSGVRKFENGHHDDGIIPIVVNILEDRTEFFGGLKKILTDKYKTM